MFGKIKNGIFKEAGLRIKSGDRQIINPTEADLIAAGYLPVELSTDESISNLYMEQDGKIVPIPYNQLTTAE